MLNRITPLAYAAPAPYSRLRFFAPPVDEGAGDDDGQNGEDDKEKFDYPKETPLADMTVDQKAEYWREKAQSHEKRFKALKDVTPESYSQLVVENQRLKTAQLSDSDKAIEAAKESGRTEVRATSAAQTIDAALSIALRGRVADASALFGLDKATFVKDGKADVDAIVAWVDENSEVKGTQKKGGPDLGQGRERGTSAPEKGVSTGADLYTNKRKTKTNES